MSATTIWRTCPSCGRSFEQPDDPGRKRVYCSRACQQAAYRARQRHSSAQQRTSRQDWRQERCSKRHEQRRPPPGGANGYRPGATSDDELARIRRIIAALLRKAASTFPHEAAACREKAKALRAKSATVLRVTDATRQCQRGSPIALLPGRLGNP
jgi:hypothetical protein